MELSAVLFLFILAHAMMNHSVVITTKGGEKGHLSGKCIYLVKKRVTITPLLGRDDSSTVSGPSVRHVGRFRRFYHDARHKLHRIFEWWKDDEQ